MIEETGFCSMWLEVIDRDDGNVEWDGDYSRRKTGEPSSECQGLNSGGN